MSRDLLPLNYAIMKLFEDGKPRCARDVVEELDAAYGRYRLLTIKDIGEALATAKENGLLFETRLSFSDETGLSIFYKTTPYGKSLTEHYLT